MQLRCFFSHRIRERWHACLVARPPMFRKIGLVSRAALRNGTVWVNPTGNPAMAKGGMGDVLTGMLAGMISQSTESAQTQSLAAVYLHGLAGDLARDEADEHTILATDLLKTLPRAFHVARERMGEKLIRIR